ncbi:MAG: HAD-IIB family hydrolase [Selenomonadaceae bacterium]|nr:HAD-IIB family hydrolase [Selenomonadaceae bacterium]MBQ3727530.1 HAD-IIB family hydrolase [Selenomonadaceae bacterium]
MGIRNEELGIRNEKSFPLKIAASDFDGTLFREQKISAEDFAAIKNWRAAGNKFGLVTGRCYQMLTPHLREFNLALDFAICCNGAIICDGAGKILFETEIPPKILLEIMREPFMAQNSLHFLFEAADETFCVNVKENSWVMREKNLWGFFLTFVEGAQVESLPKKINQLALGFETSETAQFAADFLNRKYGAQIFAQRNTHSLDIVPAGMNKGAGVAKLLELKNWRGKIFVVGDESNDLPMIKKFGGYTVATAKDFVKREASAVFESVGMMLNHFRKIS